MHVTNFTQRRSLADNGRACLWLWVFIGCLLSGINGCAAFRPIHGVPVKYLPDQYKATTRSGKKTIDLSLLRQTPPPEYLLDTGDILAVYIEGILGSRESAPPVFYPRNEEVPPSFGYPRPVRDNGTISLPMIEPLYVRGMSIHQLEDLLRVEYIQKRQLLQPGNDRIMIMLQKPRTYRILVIRQETGNDTPRISAQGTINLGLSKRGTGKIVNLPAGTNDVLNALSETGGLPGLDAENTIYVVRRKGRGRPPILPQRVSANRTSRTIMRAQSPDVHSFSPASTEHPAQEQSAFDHAAYEQWVNQQSQYAETPHDSVDHYPVEVEYYSQDAAQHAPMMAPQHALDTEQPHDALALEYQQRIQPIDARQPQIFDPQSSQPALTFPQHGTFPQHNNPPYLPQDGQYPVPQHDPVPQHQQEFGYPPHAPPVGLPAHRHGDEPGPYYGNQPGHNGEGWAPLDQLDWDPAVMSLDPTIDNPQTIKIPVRLAEGEQVHFTEQDIILQDGDVVFIESRDTEIFYTGGLLGGGQYSLPRDYDLDILGALSIAQSQRGGQNRSMGGASALNQDVTISASRVVILRQLGNGDQVPIEIDLYEALKNPHERILIQPGDYILLQYTPLEAVGAFIERNLLEGALFGLATSTLTTGGGGQ
ncbi:MAG: polysaccharide biosynthesis/export family protein [Planctomycetaceae bacterium]